MYNANEMGPSQCLHIVSNIYNTDNEYIYTQQTKADFLHCFCLVPQMLNVGCKNSFQYCIKNYVHT